MPICVVLLTSTWLYPWPLIVRFRLSRAEFEGAVAACLKGSPPSSPTWVGHYRVERVDRSVGGQIRFFSGASLIDPVGFIYTKNPQAPNYVTMPVAFFWYTFED